MPVTFGGSQDIPYFPQRDYTKDKLKKSENQEEIKPAQTEETSHAIPTEEDPSAQRANLPINLEETSTTISVSVLDVSIVEADIQAKKRLLGNISTNNLMDTPQKSRAAINKQEGIQAEAQRLLKQKAPDHIPMREMDRAYGPNDAVGTNERYVIRDAFGNPKFHFFPSRGRADLQNHMDPEISKLNSGFSKGYDLLRMSEAMNHKDIDLPETQVVTLSSKHFSSNKETIALEGVLMEHISGEGDLQKFIDQKIGAIQENPAIAPDDKYSEELKLNNKILESISFKSKVQVWVHQRRVVDTDTQNKGNCLMVMNAATHKYEIKYCDPDKTFPEDAITPLARSWLVDEPGMDKPLPHDEHKMALAMAKKAYNATMADHKPELKSLMSTLTPEQILNPPLHTSSDKPSPNAKGLSAIGGQALLVAWAHQKILLRAMEKNLSPFTTEAMLSDRPEPAYRVSLSAEIQQLVRKTSEIREPAIQNEVVALLLSASEQVQKSGATGTKALKIYDHVFDSYFKKYKK